MATATRSRPHRPARRPPAAARRPSAGTSIQTNPVSYYRQPGQGRTLAAGGYKLGQQGSIYRLQTRSGQQLEGRLPSRTYHRIVLAEFVGTVLITAAAPLVVPQKSTTVTFAGPVVRLTAVCIVFFVLALMATGEKTGKVAAAFGGLVLVGSAVNAGDLWNALGAAAGASSAPSSSSGGGLTAAQQEQASGIAPGATGRAPV